MQINELVIDLVLLFLHCSSLITTENPAKLAQEKRSATSTGIVLMAETLNLNQFQDVFKMHACHHVLNNFNNIDLKFDIFPAITRRPVMKTSILSFKYRVTNELNNMWVPHDYPNKTKQYTVEDRTHVPCPKSKFLSDMVYGRMDYIYDFCFRIKLPTYSAQTKPWNCQLDVFLMPPTEILRSTYYPRSFTIPKALGSTEFMKMIPSTRPTFHILVVWNNRLQGNDIKAWLNEEPQFSFVSFSPEIGIVTIYEDSTPYLTFTDFLIYTYKQNQWKAAKCDSPEMFYRDIECSQFQSKNAVGDLVDNEGMSAWRIVCVPVKSGEPQYHPILSHFCHCGLEKKYGRTNRANLPREEFNDQVYIGITLIWLTIMKNYSLYSYDENCLNGAWVKGVFQIQSKLQVYNIAPNASLNYVLSFNDSLQDFKFVSCGAANGVEDIRFSEIHNVFDKCTWICILVSSAFTCIALQWTLQGAYTSRISKIWHLVKVYLEQNGPFADKVSFRSKPIVGTTLLVGIVLSNAYKNVNVYNMVLPRNVVPFRDITELVKNNFTIYSRPAYLGYNNIVETIQYMTLDSMSSIFKCKLRQHWFACEPWFDGRRGLLVETEIKLRTDDNVYKTETMTGHPVQSLVKLLPIYEIFVKVINNLHEKYIKTEAVGRIHPMLYDKAKEEIRTKFVEYSNQNLYKFLNDCSRSAALLTEYWSITYAQKLKRAGRKKVFVGEDRYFETNHGFQIEGKIHRNLVKRIAAMQFSGIWNWWPRFAREYFDYSSTYERQDISRPTMEVVPFGAPHGMLSDLVFHGYHLPNKANIFANLYGVHRYPQIWEDPETVKPERFLSVDGTKYLQNDALLPFSEGKTKCIGYTFGKNTLFLFVTSIFQQFNVVPDPEKDKFGFELEAGFLLVTKPFNILVSSRKR